MAAISLVIGTSCKKQESVEQKTWGTRVSMTEFRDAFQDATNATVQAWVSDVAIGVHYGQYSNALATLGKLANHPGVTAGQKKVTTKVISQVEQLAAKARARGGS